VLFSSLIVADRLAACATTLPGAMSFYPWEQKMHRESEVVVMFKTRVECIKKLAARLKSLHPYKTPEILSFTPDCHDPGYTEWLFETVPPS
jgi:periplasmic divalent cation tolerance protein